MFHPKILNTFGLMSRYKVVYGSFHVKLNVSMLCFQIGFQLNIHIVILIIRVLIRTTKKFWENNSKSLEVKMGQSLKQPFCSTLFWNVLKPISKLFSVYRLKQRVWYFWWHDIAIVTKFTSLCTEKNTIA